MSSASEDLKRQLDALLAKARAQAATARHLADQLEELRRKIAEMERSENER